MTLPNQLHPLDIDPTAYRLEQHTVLPSWLRTQATRVVQAFFGTLPVGGLGGDVSKWQVGVDWNKAIANGWQFAFIRVLNGLTEDTKFQAHWRNSRLAGLRRGVYAYYIDALDPVEQADRLFAILSSTGDLGELEVVADIEEINNPVITPSKVKKYLERLVYLFGPNKVMVYSGRYVIQRWFNGAGWLAAYPLWLAQYTLAGWKPNHLELVKQYPPTPPAPWAMWTGNENEPLPGKVAVWQFTASCPASLYGVSGTVVDLDYCSPAWAKKHGLGVPPPPPDPEPTGDWQMQFKAKFTFNIRSGPGTNYADIGDLAGGTIISALQIVPVNAGSVWVEFEPGKWAAMVHNGGWYLDFHAAVPC